MYTSAQKISAFYAMTNTAVEVKSEDLLAALNQNLDRSFYLADRAAAKQLFAKLKNGESVPIMKLGFSDESEIHCSLALDHSLFEGKLNFGNFRRNLAMMMLAIKTRLEDELPLNVMRDASGQVLFNVPGIVRNDTVTNILVCGLAQTAANEATINLMFLDAKAYELALNSTS